MSMLAERKRKQKWSLNPRGKHWAEDTNKYGQKLMEKMGWSSGKGLGAKEDGITEHIKVSYKNDSKGMGYKESNDQWTEHESNFSALLESLTGEEADISKVEKVETSLEKKSQTSRVRVHYHKFTRGKDLSRYSEKDLANIFGKKSLKDKKKEEIVVEEKTDATPENNFLINSGSITDYFKRKLPSFGKTNGFVIGNNGVLQKAESESESEERVGFGFGYKSETGFGLGYKSEVKESFVSYINGDAQESTKKRKVNADETVMPSKKVKLESKEKGKKKKKKVKQEQEEDCGLNNPAFDPMYNQVTVEKHVLNPIVEAEEERVNLDMENVQNNKDSEDETPKKKKKNKGKNKEGLDNSAFNEVFSESTIELKNPYEVKSKSKKKKPVYEGLDNPNLQLDDSLDVGVVEVIEENPFEVKVKSKKKKRKDEEMSKASENSYAVNNPSFHADDSVSEVAQEENSFEVKVKSKTKKRKDEILNITDSSFALDNPNFNADDSVSEIVPEENPFEVKQKKKKKKKKNDEVEESKENVDINPLPVMPECDLMLNVVTTPIIKTPNSAAKAVIKRRKSVRFSDVNEERIIPNKEDILMMTEKHELFNINTQVIANGMEEGNSDAFDISSIDQVSFTEPTIKSSKKRKRGLENGAFDETKNQIEENIDSISKTLDRYQAEIENDLNEAKVKTVQLSDILVGDVASSISTNVKTEEGTKLKFAGIKFNKSLPYFENATGPKKSYKHLIKGDITVAFKNTNLHKIKGYATSKNVAV